MPMFVLVLQVPFLVSPATSGPLTTFWRGANS